MSRRLAGDAATGRRVGVGQETAAATIPTAPFGRTGHDSTRVIFGAAALGTMRQEKADEVLGTLLRYGINHIDTAAMYGDSEVRIGPWMAEHRDRFFVATKTTERSGDAARASLERSLERLQVDAVDMIQLHNLVEEDEWEQATAPGGALAALLQARDQGLCRFVGVTGHGLRIAGMHRRSLERHDFDAVLLPFSWVLLRDDGYRADVEALLALCAERGVAVQTIKSVARRRWSDAPADAGPRHSWYEPLDDPGALERSVAWVLSHAQLFLNTSSDAGRLEPTLDAAARALAGALPIPTDAQLDADVTAQGIRPLFDGTTLERVGD
jgi:aryl-alcohol dehydrogenase-like predicted oxidoreductase